MSNIRYEDHYNLNEEMECIEQDVDEALLKAVKFAAQKIADDIIDHYAEDVDLDAEREEVEDAVARGLLDAYYDRLVSRYEKVAKALTVLMEGVKARRKGEVKHEQDL